MKKTYMTPATNVVNLQLQDMITTGSIPGDGKHVGNGTASGEVQLSRQSSDWGDDD